MLTHAQLMHEVSASSEPQYLRVYMRQLRQKLEADPERPRILLTETGVGYRLRAPDDEPNLNAARGERRQAGGDGDEP